MCTYKPKSLLEKITERALECTNTSQEIPEYIQTIAYSLLHRRRCDNSSTSREK